MFRSLMGSGSNKYKNVMKLKVSTLRSITSETTTSTSVPITSVIPSFRDALASSFRCLENNPVNHSSNHESKFYTISNEDYKRLFTFGGIPREEQQRIKAFNEFCVMVRKPALEVMCYLQQTNYSFPVNRYVLYGVLGSGKTTSLAHVIHLCSLQNWMIVHVPWPPLYNRFPREIVPSTYKEGRMDLPYHAVVWLQHFRMQNVALLQSLQPRIRNTYTWSKREVTEEGSLLTDIIEHGINRVKFSSDCVGAILKEIKLMANNGMFRVLVAVDAVNAFFQTRTRLQREDRSPVTSDDISLTWNFRKMLKTDWKNGAVVTTVDVIGSPSDHRESHLPRYLLNKQGFELLDPFIPISVDNYNLKEIHSCLDYYIDRRWIQEKGMTDEGKEQLIFLSGYNPAKLFEICAPY